MYIINVGSTRHTKVQYYLWLVQSSQSGFHEAGRANLCSTWRNKSTISSNTAELRQNWQWKARSMYVEVIILFYEAVVLTEVLSIFTLLYKALKKNLNSKMICSPCAVEAT